jgi:hypothetical protein
LEIGHFLSNLLEDTRFLKVIILTSHEESLVLKNDNLCQNRLKWRDPTPEQFATLFEGLLRIRNKMHLVAKINLVEHDIFKKFYNLITVLDCRYWADNIENKDLDSILLDLEEQSKLLNNNEN